MYTADDLTAIEDAIKSGTLKVKYSDKEVTYRSLSELLMIRDLIRKDLGIVGGKPVRVKAEFNKGFIPPRRNDR